MRWRPTARFLCLILASPVLTGSTARVDARSGQSGAPSRVRVWIYTTGPIDPADRERATQAADALFGPAGVSVDWHPCDRPAACARGDVTAPSVTVILMSAERPMCGLTAFEPDGRSATVLVSMPCVAALTLDVQRPQAVRSHPLVATLDAIFAFHDRL